jgi:Bacterial regulatory proteins, luxR family
VLVSEPTRSALPEVHSTFVVSRAIVATLNARDAERVVPPAPPAKTFVFDRGPGRDFTERDRLVLDVLEPHLGHLWRVARNRRRLRAALAVVESQGEHEPRGVIVLAPGGRIEVISPAARRLVREFFSLSCEAEVPLGAGRLARRARELERRDRRLTIERSADARILEETREELGLTAREREILACVARGKTHPEIGKLLGISPTRVRKHLEHV